MPSGLPASSSTSAVREFAVTALADVASVASNVSSRPGRCSVALTPGPRFGVDGVFESRLRLPFSRPLPELEAAVARLAPVWRGLTSRPGGSEEDLLVV